MAKTTLSAIKHNIIIIIAFIFYLSDGFYLKHSPTHLPCVLRIVKGLNQCNKNVGVNLSASEFYVSVKATATFGQLISFLVGGEGGIKPSGCQSDLNQCPTDLCPESNNRWTRAGSAGDYFHALCGNKQNA